MPIYQDLYILDNNNMTLNRSFIYLKTAYNSDGLINCLRQPGQLRNRPPKAMIVNVNPLIKSCGTLTNSAAETESIGLPADALVPCFLLATWTISSWHENSLPFIGTWYRQDNFIVTTGCSSIYRDWQKPRHRDADGNYLNRRAVSGHDPTIIVVKFVCKYL